MHLMDNLIGGTPGSADPMLNTMVNHEKELFSRFASAADGFTHDDVVGAAINLIINGVRQHAKTRPEAERLFDELFARAKTVLTDHYDMLGRKRGIFPHHQVIDMTTFRERNRF